MGTVKIHNVSKIAIPKVSLTDKDKTQIGGQAIRLMIDRVRGKHAGTNDLPMRPYSPRGPIYVPTTGPGRTKKTLKGREVLTPRDIRVMRSRGLYVAGMRGGKQHSTMGVVAGRTRKSLKFANYSEYKRALGKSGLRDLELSGRMLGSLTITRKEKLAVELGFTREEEHRKAVSNEKLSPWFGLSGQNVKQLTNMVSQIVTTNIKS